MTDEVPLLESLPEEDVAAFKEESVPDAKHKVSGHALHKEGEEPVEGHHAHVKLLLLKLNMQCWHKPAKKEYAKEGEEERKKQNSQDEKKKKK